MGKKDKPETKKIENKKDDKKNDKKDETVMYQPIKKFPKTKAAKKEKKVKQKKKGHPKLKKFILIVFIMFLIIGITLRRSFRCNCLPLYLGRLGN